jgi:hypothetical protein
LTQIEKGEDLTISPPNPFEDDTRISGSRRPHLNSFPIHTTLNPNRITRLDEISSTLDRAERTRETILNTRIPIRTRTVHTILVDEEREIELRRNRIIRRSRILRILRSRISRKRRYARCKREQENEDENKVPSHTPTNA